jgi:NAD(P)-dependent dehydrogenase (short-subunit alcohol dehydrogenase family)
MAGEGNARVAVITGASSGIGLVTAKALAAQGWRIIGHGRNPERIAAAEAQIRAAAAPGVRVDMIRADLALVLEAARAAEEIAGLSDRIDVLVNNAGGTSNGQAITAEGNEATFAGNHLGHFVLTERLLPKLKAAASTSAPGAVRIINVSSSAHEYTTGLDWEDLQWLKRDFVPIRAYCDVKLCNVLYTRALAKRLAGTGIVVHAMHPGAVDTNFINYADPVTQDTLRTNGMITAEDGADTVIWLTAATEPGQATGQYYYQRTITPTSPLADDAQSAERLWSESEKLAAAVI